MPAPKGKKKSDYFMRGSKTRARKVASNKARRRGNGLILGLLTPLQAVGIVAIWFVFSGIRKLISPLLVLLGIKEKDDGVKDGKLAETVGYNSRNLQHNTWYFQNLCNQMEARMEEKVYIGFPFIDDLKKLNTDELKFLVKVYGTRTHDGYWGFGGYSGNLFRWFEEEFSGFLSRSIYNDLKDVFKKTGLW